MSVNPTILRNQIGEQYAIIDNSHSLKVQQKAMKKIEKLERRLHCVEEGKDPSNNNGRMAALAAGAVLAPFTGGTSLIMAGLHVGCSMIGEGVTGTDTYVSPDQPTKADEIARLEAELAALKNS